MRNFGIGVAVALSLFSAPGCGGGGDSVVVIPAKSSAMALLLPPNLCEAVGPLGTSVSESSLGIVILGSVSLPDVCAALADPCRSFPSITEIVLMVTSVDETGMDAATIGPGTYELTQQLSAPRGIWASAGMGKTDAACNVLQERGETVPKAPSPSIP